MLVNTKKRDTQQRQYKVISVPGAFWRETIWLNPEDVYVPKNDTEGSFNNLVRAKLDKGHINKLAEILRNGCDMTEHPPVVVRLKKPKLVNGKMYSYELICGFHRAAALKKAWIDNWPFAVYEFEDDLAVIRFAKLENNHALSRQATADDLANTLAYMVNQGWIQNTEADMEDELSVMTNIHGNTKNAAIRRAIRMTGAYQDFMTYTFQDVVEFLSLHTNYDENRPMYSYKGMIDKFRDAHGWSVLEGYESEFLMNAINSFNDTGKESYFICHTKSPTEKRDLYEKRNKMRDTFSELENALDKVLQHRQETGRYPWQVEAFLPQNNLEGEKGFVA
jgi:hypothetical protein